MSATFLPPFPCVHLRPRQPTQSTVCPTPHILAPWTLPPSPRRAHRSPSLNAGRGSLSDETPPADGDDDVRLQRELARKVRELYGAPENVAIESSADDSVEFRVLTAPDGTDATAYRQAWYTIGGIVACAVLSIAVFAAMVNMGAVHTAERQERTYDLPTYRTRSYVEPYDLLQEETRVVK